MTFCAEVRMNPMPPEEISTCGDQLDETDIALLQGLGRRRFSCPSHEHTIDRTASLGM